MDIADTIERFVDYWTALPGKGATKLDWDKTFRNFVKTAWAPPKQITPKPPSHAPAKPALDRLPDDKRRENLERLSGMFDNLFQKVTP